MANSIKQPSWSDNVIEDRSLSLPQKPDVEAVATEMDTGLRIQSPADRNAG
jgi:hypothetical protein